MMKTYIVKVAASQMYDVEVRAESKAKATVEAELQVADSVNSGELRAKHMTLSTTNVKEKKVPYMDYYDFGEGKYAVGKQDAKYAIAFFAERKDAEDYAEMRNHKEDLL